ncbi:uncharacterized protein LOC119693304 isoform X5 [Plutella xylostella]|uniref:uncharacterized protein LOC119693304 isoform X5 n=1 Tax=Plutella xylostella TaxID=51655 RepID=UPI002032CBD2|nr:uncharacterized protein LOC119693304 isoform X5 [Plutella xylostella]
MNTEKELIKKRGGVKAKLTQFSTYLNIAKSSDKLSKLQANELKCRLEKIEDLYSVFDKLQLELEDLADDAEERYNERSQLEGQYYELVSQARTLLEGQLDPAHNQKTKWHRSSPEQLMEGTLVLVKDRTMPPLLWPLGRIIKVHPGTDGITRVVDVLTKKGTIQRAYNNICPLPTS